MSRRLRQLAQFSLAGTTAAWASCACAQCTPQWSGYTGPILSDGVWCAAAWDPDGVGPAPAVVVVGGNFEYAGSTVLNLVGAWDGGQWQPMSVGVDGTVASITIYDPDGTGGSPSAPVIGGYFNRSGSAILNAIGVFEDGHWSPLGSGMGNSPIVESLALHGQNLVAGGLFTQAGGVPVQGLARWDGAAWHAFPDERPGAPYALASLNGSLYAGGHWRVPGSSTEFTGILRWVDPVWVVVGSNFPKDNVRAIVLYNGQVVVAGDFTGCCGTPAPGEHIARFDGTTWLPLGSGLNNRVRALTAFDPDGPGPMPELLIAGGVFSQAGGQPANCIAAWNGSSWMPLGSGTAGEVRALTVWNNQLVAAGFFFSAGGIVSPGMAFWGCPQPPPCYPNCDQSTVSPVLNIADFACFLNAFSTASPYANCDGSTAAPAMNIHDFICFLNRFVAGCS